MATTRRRRATAGRPASKRRAVALLAGGALVLIVFGLAAIAVAYTQIGRTPVEIIGHAKHRLEGHGWVERTARPVLDGLAHWFGEPAPGDLAAPFVVPPLPPNPATQAGAAAAPPRPAPSPAAAANIIRVGIQQAVATISHAAAVAKDGDTIEIDAGDYVADVAVWDRAELTIRGVGDRVRLIASGADAEGKATWVIRRGKVTVENVDFIGARAADGNGAGIRLEGGHLVVRRCRFFNNQNGILTGSDAETRLEIENSEFGYNGGGDGLSHGIYVGGIRSVKVTGSYFHHANVGHLIKSRAQESLLAYNRITDETGGRASYELEFPNGGAATVVGNIIQQGALTRNSVIVAYGAEGYRWPLNRIQFVHNTVVNDQPYGGTFLRVEPGATAAITRNNLLVGKGRVDTSNVGDSAGDVSGDWSDFVQAAREDYRLSEKGRRRLAGRPLAATAAALVPLAEYEHPARTHKLAAPPAYPGAVQAPGP